MSKQESDSVKLTVSANALTLSQYPWPFQAELQMQLRGTCLRLDTRITNLGCEAMPYGLGFHPYFVVNDKAKATIPSGATRAFDNVAKSVVPFRGFDFTQHEVDIHLLDHPEHAATLHLKDGARIVVRGSNDISRWVVWTLAGREFVCLEPWTAPGNALNSREHLIVLPAEATHSTRVEIEFHG